jgi:bifunctional UDP-N-acetylglucosamine pyrophosphorylase/glucosamine-1-phosphate N-acetyltransferase
MLSAESIETKLTDLGLPADFTICFESVVDLYNEGMIAESELSAVKNLLDFFDLVNTVNVRSIMGFIESGVIFASLDGILISPFAKIGRGTTVYPNTQIRKNVTIGTGCVIGPSSVVEDSTIGNDCIVNATQMYQSVMEDNVKIGPFCHIRPNSHLCSGVKIGDFVEIKNSTIGADSHASHLTYIGDSDVGERVNFGCGTVTSNYNGYTKARCVIGDDCFIGCNTNLIAPVTIGKGGYTAAGSTITANVPDGALGIARQRQVNKEGWVETFKEKNKK